MLWIFTNDHYTAFAFDDFAFVTHLLDGLTFILVPPCLLVTIGNSAVL